MSKKYQNTQAIVGPGKLDFLGDTIERKNNLSFVKISSSENKQKNPMTPIFKLHYYHCYEIENLKYKHESSYLLQNGWQLNCTLFCL